MTTGDTFAFRPHAARSKSRVDAQIPAARFPQAGMTVKQELLG